jgi:DNA-binding NarL/FixJ family response regulator
MIRIMIVHDVCLYNDLLATTLNTAADIQVAAQVAHADEALALLGKHTYDVVLLDQMLPDQGAALVMKWLQKTDASAKIVIAGQVKSKTAAMRCFEMGAYGYVHQECSVADLIAIIRSAAQGQSQLSPELAGMLIGRLAQLKRLATELNGYQEKDLEDQASELTKRECEVLELIGAAYTNQEIADELVIGVGTVKNHVHNILEKLDVHTRKQVAMVARQLAVSRQGTTDEELFSWPEAMGIEIHSRREAAAIVSERL